MCLHENVLIEAPVCIHLVTQFPICARPTCFHAVCLLRDIFMRVFTH